MRPVNDGDPKSMDKFADALERTIVVEKLPNNLLKEYHCWVKEQGKNETEMKYGFTIKYKDIKRSPQDGKNNKSYGTSLQDGKKGKTMQSLWKSAPS